MRCLTLAERLAARGWTCRFAVGSETQQLAPSVVRYAPIFVSGAPEEEVKTLADAIPDGCELLIVDHYDRDAAFETSCRVFARVILVIDDLANRQHDCDLLLDQTLGRADADYRALVPKACRLLLGPSYALLRPQFGAARQTALARRHAKKPIQRIFVSFGASNSRGVGVRIVRALMSLMPDVVVHFAGWFGSELDSLRLEYPDRVIAHGPVNDVTTLMTEADFAIGAGGTMSWERCALGLPTALIVLADNQAALSARLSQAGAILLLGSTDIDCVDAAKRIANLATDADSLAKMSAAAAAIVDGCGAGRVVVEVDPPRTRFGVPIWLRPVRAKDADMMYAWQTESGARTYTRNPDPPSKAEHVEWFRKRTRLGSGLFSVICHGTEDCGVVRCDPVEGGVFEVTILIAGRFRGYGIAAPALTVAASMMAPASLIAEIHPNNEPSRRAFLAAGFVRRSERKFVLCKSRLDCISRAAIESVC